jgi:hypothetical protein
MDSERARAIAERLTTDEAWSPPYARGLRPLRPTTGVGAMSPTGGPR